MVEAKEAAYLSVQMRHRIGALRIDVNFELTQPWTILFGPSGSGKTTILRAIAGLLRPDSAKIVSAGTQGSKQEQRLLLVDTEAGVWTPPHRRGIPLAPQAASLFPHLTVRENIGYGDREEHALTAQPALFEIGQYLAKRPGELSGGEAQRVNLARAVATSGAQLLLLDEPFTGLDLKLKEDLIACLLAWQSRSRTPILSVTHDVAEAFQLDAEIVKLRGGRIVEQGPVATVLAAERALLLEQLSSSQ